jgi:hypothetical protein
MPRTASNIPIGREFDRFLFATIADDRHGQRLSVLSLLARSDVDPWEAAVHLMNMPGEMATARLAGLIAALPDAAMAKLPADAIAADLIGLLPRASDPAKTPGPGWDLPASLFWSRSHWWSPARNREDRGRGLSRLPR